MRVTRLPKDPGPPGWNTLLPPDDPAIPLEEDKRADWLVIGAGFAGLAAARRLSELHGTDRIVVLDATRVAHGPAGRNSGFMIDLPHDLSHNDYAAGNDFAGEIAANRAGIVYAGEAAQAYGLDREAYDLTGKINAAASTKGMALNTAYARHLRDIGEPHELLDAAEMQRITGIPYYQGGLFTPGTAMIQPAAYVRGVARGLR
ncbi:MAG: FAD-dependent oxidoreductase, partial [Pseudomonadota bacterium]